MKARHPLRTAAIVLGLFGSMLLSGIARAELYKWTDDEGNVIYSQVPPPDRDVKTIAPPPPAPSSPTPAVRTAPEGSAGAGDNTSVSEDEKANKEIVARIARKNCEIARRNLDIYKNHNRIRNNQGEVTVLDDTTRAAKIKEAEQAIKDFCK
jgi:hypothetical protein